MITQSGQSPVLECGPHTWLRKWTDPAMPSAPANDLECALQCANTVRPLIELGVSVAPHEGAPPLFMSEGLLLAQEGYATLLQSPHHAFQCTFTAVWWEVAQSRLSMCPVGPHPSSQPPNPVPHLLKGPESSGGFPEWD